MEIGAQFFSSRVRRDKGITIEMLVVSRLLLSPLLFLMLVAEVYAQFTFTTNNGTITITGYTGPGGAVTIPSTTNGLPVTSIRNSAFYGNSSFTSVSIPDSVTTIGNGAFQSCQNMSGVAIPFGTTKIGPYAFDSCRRLSSVTVPGTITNIAFHTFSGCTSLTNVTIADSVTSIGYNAFSGCSRLPGVTIPSSVTCIGNSAFDSCTRLTSATIGDSVTSIGTNAFYRCTSLTNISIGRNVTSIGAEAFSRCTSLGEITVDALNSFYSSLDGVLFDKNQATLIQFPGGKAGPYRIPDSVTNIGDYAFYDSAGVTSVTIPDSVINIGEDAFALCQRLAHLTIGSNVTSIGFGAFQSCVSLSNVTIPDSVFSIGRYAFVKCASLTSVIIGNNVTNIAAAAFVECTRLTSVTIGSRVNSIGQSAFALCSSLRSVSIPNSVTSIGESAFTGCTSLAKVMISRSITNLGSWAFASCTNLTRAYFMGNAPSVGSGVFQDDNNLVVYYLPGTTGWGPTFGGSPTAPWTPPPPTVRCSAPSILECTNGAATGMVQAEVLDSNGFPLEMVWTVNGTSYQTNQIPAGGNFTASNLTFTANFETGVHAVVVSASNGHANPATCTTTVMVVDSVPPHIGRISATPNVLWPPNRRMIPVSVMVEAVDTCDPSPVVRITRVTSTEPQNPLAPDWEITGPRSLNLRADRLGKGKGRVYTIMVQCEDGSGNVSSASVNVTVPHN